jgi:predicted RNA polymerase sigma factor
VRQAAAPGLLVMAEAMEGAVESAEIPDRRLGLMFACAHPAIDPAVRAPLMLQAILGLDAAAIGSAFLVSPAAMGKRLGRAKLKIRAAGIPLVVPDRAELAGRLEAVLDAVYAAYARGWTDPAGTDLARRELTGEALFLARLVAELLPEEPEALGLLALLLHAEARRGARRGDRGEYVPLAEQDVERWEWPMIAEAETLIRRTAALGVVGRYQLEAAIQSAHVHGREAGRPDRAAVVELYDALLGLTGSPIVAINRALAVAELDGAAAGLAALREVEGDPRVQQYQPWWAGMAELLARTGAWEGARQAYEVAIGLESQPAVREYLARRKAGLGR